MGFSTGTWDGHTLTVKTTHLKQGWLRRNGVPESDLTTIWERFTRHGRNLVHTVIITDPVYLAEPHIRTTDFALSDADVPNWRWPCEYVEEITGRAKGDVPHYQPGENPYLQEFVDRTKAPAGAARGGPDTIYPEYQAKLATAAGRAQISPAEAPRTSQAAKLDGGTIEALHIQGNVWLLAGGGGNVVVQVGANGTLLVDSKSSASARMLLAEAQKLSVQGQPIRILMNTSADPDHVGGNEALAAALGSSVGWQIVGTPGATQSGVKIMAHDNVLSRVSSLPSSAWPSETYLELDKEVFFNGEPVLMQHVPSAHTDGDSIVFFRRSDVVVTGDIYRTDSYPVIDIERGGSVQGVLDGLNRVLDIAVPAHHEEGGTFIVPGHGRISDEFDVLEYRDMVTIVRDRIQAMAARKMTLAQIKAARPTRDYDSRYGAASGPWTTDMFVEAVYKSVTARPATATR
jgi:glyoxylase-like metal-dependent hydrolase (beta-lactamase superfamily II)